MFLVSLGYDVHGDWDDWHITATGASKSQIWGSERTDIYDRDAEWTLEYFGDSPLARSLHEFRICGRYPVKQCLQPGAKLKPYVVEDRPMRRHIGMEIDPPEESEGEFIAPRQRKKPVLIYACEKCGHEWEFGRTLTVDKEHTRDGGRLVFVRKEVE